MTVSTTTNRASYSGNGSTTAFAYGFKIFADADLTVIIRSSAGVETTKTLSTHYTVSGAGNASGGNVTFTSGNVPASGETVVILRQLTLTQGTDYVANDPFPAESHEDALDRLTMVTQQLDEEIGRTLKVSQTNVISSPEFTADATARANKLLSFDASGNLIATQEIGVFKGDSATTTTSAFTVRDIVKATTTAQLNNIYICVADSVVGDALTDTDHFALIVDAVAAASSATAAASSATAAASSASTASTQASNASTSASTSSTQATNSANSATASASSATAAAASAASAAASLDAFDDNYLGAKSSDPSTDNDGDALNAGDLYFNTSSNVLKVYNGSAWQEATLVTTATTAELNIMDGDTSASSTTVVDADRVVFNDAGTMKQVAVTDLAAYFDDEITAMPNLVTTAATTVGALNSGSITSGFGAIDNGSSNITTTGVGTFASLDISGNIDVDGTTNLDVVDIDGAVDMASTLGVAGVVTANAGIVVDNITIDGTEIDLSSGSLTIDVAGDLILDADGGGFLYKDGGTEIGRLFNSSSDFIIKSIVSDKDLKIQGNDGGATINAVVFDMSAAGAAAFNSGATFADGCTITTADNTTQLTLTSTDADATAGPRLDLKRDSGSPADNDTIGRIRFLFDNDAAEQIEGVRIDGHITDASDGTEDTSFNISTVKAGTLQQSVKFGASETVFNESSLDVDFRVESNGAANMLFVDGGNDAIGINTNSPLSSSRLHIFEGTRNGSYAINGSRDSLIIEDSQHAGMSICGGAGNSGTASIAFPNGSSNIDGLISYNLDGRSLEFHSGGSERARINSAGALLIGKTSDSIANTGISAAGSATGGGHLSATNNSSAAFALNRGDSDGQIAQFNRAGSVVGNISVTTSNTSYNTSSDRRLKSNIQDAASASSKIDAMQVRQFDWNVDGSHQDYGLIAQELEPIAPIAVCSGDDDDEMMSVDYSKLVPMLIKEIQELRSRVAALEE